MRAVILAEKGAEIDYAEVADPDTLDPLEMAGGRTVLLVAARFGATRLIDNLLLS
jgi:pantoate--beta-alanine ligase